MIPLGYAEQLQPLAVSQWLPAQSITLFHELFDKTLPHMNVAFKIAVFP
jgi:hypothetical protein